MGKNGRLMWVFESGESYQSAMEILDEEPSNCLFT